MNLTIKTVYKDYDDNFYDWLIDKIQQFGVGIIQKNKLYEIDKYINEVSEFKSIFRKSFISYEILCAFFYNLKTTTYWDKVVIEVNPNAIMPSSNVKIITLARLITYGTLNLQGYPLVLDVFDYFEENIDTFYEMYERGL